MRAYAAETNLIDALKDKSPLVRREAAMALAWCGGRAAVNPLTDALIDDDWTTRQSAHVALSNITGQSFSFDALASESNRDKQVDRWRQWLRHLPPLSQGPPPELLKLLKTTPRGAPAPGGKGAVSVSSVYKGSPKVLTDGQVGPGFWQTKNVAFPQWCTVDLGKPRTIRRVVVHQHSDRFVMTDYELATSMDNKRFDTIVRRKRPSPVNLAIEFKPRTARYVRVTSYGTVNPTYPTTFFEIEIDGFNELRSGQSELFDGRLRAVRALGALGGHGATEAIIDLIGPSPATNPRSRPMVQSAIRSLGRLRDEASFNALIALLDNPMWARYAADALGDFGDRRAVAPLIAAYARYAKDINGKDPPNVPRDDKMRFPSEDRMLETPYWFIFALARLPLDDAADHAALRKIAPLLVANLPGDHDAAVLYEREAHHALTAFLLEQTGLRQEVVEAAFEKLGQARRLPPPEVPADAPTWPAFKPYRISTWLPAFVHDSRDLPRLTALLEHPNRWVRLNAAKAMGWLGDQRAIDPLAKALSKSKPEAAHGYSVLFKDEEYADPAPRWREAVIRSLGTLGAQQQSAKLVRLMNDDTNVSEVRLAAAHALTDLGNDEALASLRDAADDHEFDTVRHVAREALWRRGIDSRSVRRQATRAQHGDASPVTSGGGGIVFIKGSNNIINTMRTVEQADRWMQTYVVSDAGPTYRPGRNIYRLQPAQPDGELTQLTHFDDDYVADLEVSRDATRMIFCRRGGDDPWWHIHEMNVDGTGLRKLTDGPYHHVGPNYLPDGRIVFSSSRIGVRDEYHGYPCSALYVMNANGSNMRAIATNTGRDNEPVVLHDGRIAFSRLEVFYSRLKTELTLHAVRPDGTRDVVLYGPERRQFWRELDVGPRTPAHRQENPLTHRVLRMTQPQPMPDGRSVIMSTQGGLTIVGTDRNSERIIPHDKMRAFTTPWPLADGRILCSSTKKTADRTKVEIGVYIVDPNTGELTLVYNDPATADFEARPLVPRDTPLVLPSKTASDSFTGRFICGSVFHSRGVSVARDARLVRVIEGIPNAARHSTQTGPWEVWKNHTGTLGRVLGTVPLAADGSFHVEVPADRLLHFQALDTDRRVVANQLTWMSVRPGETRSCIGCHERPNTSPAFDHFTLAASREPARCLPDGNELTYRAKAWFKGHLPDKIEDRQRTVRAVNLLAR